MEPNPELEQRRRAFAESIGVGTNPESSNRLGTARVAQIRAKAKDLVIWGALLVSWGWFTGLRAANRNLYKLSERGEINRLGSYVFTKDGKRKKGHPVTCYGPRLRGNTSLEHQVNITLLKEALKPDGWATGSACKFREDLTMLIRGRMTRWEVDMGNENKSRVANRLGEGLAGCTDPVFFVTTTPRRLRRLTGWAKAFPALRPYLHFALIGEVLADPYETEQPVYKDIDGDYVDVFHKSSGPAGIADPPPPGVPTAFPGVRS